MIKSILIIGGGSAGWITANVLNAKLNAKSGQGIKISVLESPNIPKIGVGEATVPHIRQTLHDIGIDEWDFMRATDATFKTMIRFPGWRKNSYYDHPFDRCLPEQSALNVKAWLSQKPQESVNNEFAQAFSLLTHLSDHAVAPKSRDMEPFKSPYPYAYHLDAIKLSHYLSEFGQQRGIQQFLSNVSDVTLSEEGSIESVRTEKGEVFTADLYIDCTGLKALLHKQALKVGVHDYSQFLLCDSAVAMNVSYETYKPETMNPFTTATALSSGWAWDITLRNRRGLGYVYSSSFESRSSAEDRFRKFEGAHSIECDAKHIRFSSERSLSPWFKNCVAIGLAGGFLEPLESSGLYLIECAAKYLGDALLHVDNDTVAQSRNFNRRMQLIYTEVAEYLNLHYVLSDRDDSPFWLEVQKAERILPSLREKLDLWKTKPPSWEDFDTYLQLFPVPSFEYILYGMGFKTRIPYVTTRELPDLSFAIEESLSKLPKHEDIINSL